jgi:hypothetical protein
VKISLKGWVLTMDIKEIYYEETGDIPTGLFYFKSDTRHEFFKDEYVKWLEEKLASKYTEEQDGYIYLDCRSESNKHELIIEGDFYRDSKGGSWNKCEGFVGLPVSSVVGETACIRRAVKN